MPREDPYFKKCCYFIPLKSCLQVWATIKLIVDICMVGFFVVVLGIWSLLARLDSLACMFVLIIIVMAIDGVFMTTLVVGIWTNNLRILRVLFFYSIYMVVAGLACFFGYALYMHVNIIDERKRHQLVTSFTVCGTINAVLDVGMIFTLRSEMIKLRNKQLYEFVQMPNLNKEEEKPREHFETDVEN